MRGEVDHTVNDRSGARFEAMLSSLDRGSYLAADAVLSPMLDRLERDLATYRARLDAAIGGGL
jgi:hypothetical protein